MRRTILPATLTIALAVCVASACDDPTLLRPAPELAREMILTMALDPDSSTQVLFVEAVDTEGTFEGWVRADIFDEQGALLSTIAQDSVPREHGSSELLDILRPCGQRYGMLGIANPVTCFAFQLRPVHGREYRVRVSAEGRPTAEAATMTPGDFQIVEVDANGAPPGTKGLSVRWTPSEGAFRYIVAIRSLDVTCYHVKGCLDGWYEETATTELRATVPAEKLDAGSGPWFVDVYALDRALFEYLTTGSGGDMFAIPPVENVVGGHGVIGSWVKRSKRVY